MAYGSGGTPATGSPLSLRNRLNRRKTAMWSERSSWDTHVRDVFDLTRPRRTRFSSSQHNKGDRRNNQIIDNTGVRAATVLVSGLVNGMSSPATEWFKYEPQELGLLEYGPAKAWIGMLQRLVRRIFDASNVYEALPTIYEELILSTVGVGVVEDDFEDVIRLQTFTWGEYALAINARRVVDTLYRETKMTALQGVQAFGLENVSSTVRRLYDTSNYDHTFDVMHAIEPNVDRDPSKADNRNMPFRSIYWEPACAAPDQEKWLRRSGYRQNPIIAPRWDVIGNDVYGSTCPGMEALGDMRQLQIQQKRKGEGIDKQVRPPTQGPASLADRFVSQLPGAHTVVSNMADGGIKPTVEVKPDLSGMLEDMGDTRERIRDAFYVNYILSISMIEGVQPRNQWEISERKGEGLMVLGPVVQRISNECLTPLHERTINRIYEICMPLWQMGEPAMLPPPPPELQGMPMRVQYISPLQQIQKQGGVGNIERLIGLISNPNVAQAFPGMRRKINEEQVVDILGDQLGVDQGVIRSDEEVAAIAEAEAQQAQLAQLASLAKPAADATSAIKNLADAKGSGPDEGSSVLETLAEQVPEAAA